MAENLSIARTTSFTEGPEYTAMRECNAMMVDLLQFSIGRLGDALFGKGLIPLEVKDKLRMTALSSADKTREVLDCIIQKVKYTPQIFNDFVHTLKEQDFQGVADPLLSCYHQSRTATPQRSPSLTPSTSYGDSLQFSLPLHVFKTMLESARVTSVHDDQSVIESTLGVERDITQPQPNTDRQISWETNPNYAHGAIGTRDVLLLASKKSGDNIVPRRTRASLTEEEKYKLQEQGIHEDLCHSDLSVLLARYNLDKVCTSAEVLKGEQRTCEEVKQRITELFNSTDKEGVMLHYIGPGERETGNWCFKDGVISFEGIMELYTQHLNPRGRVLEIIADCSYSGRWVKEAMTFMDGQGVGPCGHQAKEKDIFVKVITSCLGNEIPAELAFSTHCVENNEDGAIYYIIFFRGKDNLDHQHPSGLDFTQVRCNNKIDLPCTMAPESTWQQWSDDDRIRIIRSQDRGEPVWYYLLLEDDENTIQKFLTNVKKGPLDVTHYGQVLKSGWGEDPPEETKKWIEDNYLVKYNYQPSLDTIDV